MTTEEDCYCEDFEAEPDNPSLCYCGHVEEEHENGFFRPCIFFTPQEPTEA
jgi:hypothetical protein